MKNKSIKTTIGGIISSIGACLIAACVQVESPEIEPILQGIGAVMIGVGNLMSGITARDHDVTSEGTKVPRK